jgi:L-lysine exporter family protein LysE/ArgO
MFDISAFAQGFAIGLGMFVCPGPKDVLILREALRRRGALGLIAIGSLSDALLISIGIGGVSAALSGSPHLQTVALWLGILLLVVHGASAARRSVLGAAGPAARSDWVAAGSRRNALAALVACSLLNPAAWVDTLLIVGSVGAALPQSRQASFAAGAVFSSVVWFSALVICAGALGRLMTRTHSWRVLEGIVAVAMFGIAGYVASGVL